MSDCHENAVISVTEVPPCPACEEVQNAPYTIEMHWESGTVHEPAFSAVCDAVAAAALADRLEEQGCRDDAELVRRLAGLVTPKPSPWYDPSRMQERSEREFLIEWQNVPPGSGG